MPRWTAQTVVDQAIGRLQHQEIVGRVQAGAPRFLSKTICKEWKEMVVAEVTRVEEERYNIKAVPQSQPGSWTTW